MKIVYPPGAVILHYGLSSSGSTRTNLVLTDQTPQTDNIDFAQVEDGNAAIQSCLGQDTSLVQLMAWTVSPGTWTWKSVIDNEMSTIAFGATVEGIGLTHAYLCAPDFPASSFSIAGPATICAADMPVSYVVKTNKSGVKPVSWKTDPAYLKSLNIVNDSTVSILFKLPAGGPVDIKLYASGGDCQIFVDSMAIRLYPAPLPLPDGVPVCTQPVILNPGNWFKSYLWQDGSTASSYAVTQPGKYYVQLQTWCNTTMSDTVHVFAGKTGLPSTIAICAGDTATITAPAGLAQYQWTPNYHQLPVAENIVRVYPDVDTTYMLFSATADGCTLHDTVAVHIRPAQRLYLGADTTICVDDELVLDAGKLFTNYHWSTGDSSQTYTVIQAATYWVHAKGVNGCMAADTIAISSKLCPKQIYFPNAFSPDNNGRNDIFRPVVHGRMQAYELTVYNRWGSIVFKTREVSAGWDGKVNGTLQDSGAFIWVCKYQFVHEAVKVEKGTVFSVR
jgi:gliding motility-associated-like protein